MLCYVMLCYVEKYKIYKLCIQIHTFSQQEITLVL